MISHPRHPSVAFFFLPTLALALVFQGCSQPDLPLPEAEAHTAEIASWQAQRVEGLETPLGWLSVIGLTWLEPGENPFGSDPANFVRFPEALSPPRAGSFFLEEEVVRMEVEPEVEVTLDGEPVTSLVLHSAAGGRPATVWMGSLAWRVIQREDLIGVRVRDTLNAARFEFEGIETFPVSLDWVVPAHFHRHLVPRTIHVPNVLGMITETPSPGSVEFEVGGESYRLAVTGDPDGDSFFIVFGDRTNGSETYPAGRFLYVDAPDETGRLLIDFNRAHNPPCAFTPHATCPLPPDQNHLPVRIEAGEKNAHH
ncbi:DUF1684 domain-containing protein [Gemmatimonadota bacterium]